MSSQFSRRGFILYNIQYYTLHNTLPRKSCTNPLRRNLVNLHPPTGTGLTYRRGQTSLSTAQQQHRESHLEYQAPPHFVIPPPIVSIPITVKTHPEDKPSAQPVHSYRKIRAEELGNVWHCKNKGWRKAAYEQQRSETHGFPASKNLSCKM